MRLIVCEKDIAARRIASILSNKKMEVIEGNPPVYKWDDTYVIGLKGHVLDIDFEKNFKDWKTDLIGLIHSKLVKIRKQEAIIRKLEELGKKADELIIATDYDREGENIGVEAIEIVKSVNNKVKIKRAIFSAITEEDIKKSFSNLRNIDFNLASSAQARREIDLLWGASLTRFLSTSSGYLGRSFLSAGRVQTPTLALIVEREKERMNFKPKTYYEVKAELENGVIAAKKIEDKKKAEEFKNFSGYAIVKKITHRERITKPPTPFNTTEYLREAANIGFPAPQAMRIAETLYMNGFISYPRTDNTVYPKTLNIRGILKKLLNTRFSNLVKKILEKKDIVPTKGKKVSKAHPPIHPTEAAKNLEKREMKIYELIVRRFLATLSDPSKEKLTHVKFEIGGEEFTANGLVILEKGWREFYPYSKVNVNVLPEMREGEKVRVKKITIEEKQTQPPKRYGHGGIIKKMEELNLGTKATRPEILNKLISRGYVTPNLIPSPLAMNIIEVIGKYAPLISSHEMTSELEKEMDLIAEGKKTKEEVVRDSIEKLEKILKEVEKKKEEIGRGIREAKNVDLGPCPKCKEGVMRIIRSKKTGKRFIACSNYPKCKNTWPLPQKGKITILNERCKDGIRKIMIQIGKRRIVICPNPELNSKESKK